MDKKSIIARAIMHQNPRIPAAKSRNKDISERHAAFATSAKSQHYRHAYHGHCQRAQSKPFSFKKPIEYPSSAAYCLSNEEYIGATAQVWFHDSGLASPAEDGSDIIADNWDSIVQIGFYTAEQEILCPICLDSPSVARTDKCGHVYCLPCLNRFLSYDSGLYKKCALCNQHIDIHRIKRASFIPRFDPIVGDRISMVLMKRNKSDSFPVPIGSNESARADIPLVGSDHSRFSNVAICPADDWRRIIESERAVLERELAELIEQDNSEIVKSIFDSVESIERELSIANLSTALDKIDNSLESPSVENNAAVDSDQFRAIQHSHSVYYQSEDGGNVFLCPLNWKMMIHEFVDSGRSLPTRISGRLIELERFTVGPEFVNRYRYLKHLPFGVSIGFVDIDLSDWVSDETRVKFDREIQRKTDTRVYKEKVDADLTKQKIKHENSFNSSVGFVCLNSLMRETDRIVDEDFVPLSPPGGTVAPDTSSSSDKRMSFADMIHQHARKPQEQHPPAASDDSGAPPRGFSLQDCVVRRTNKRGSRNK